MLLYDLFYFCLFVDFFIFVNQKYFLFFRNDMVILDFKYKMIKKKKVGFGECGELIVCGICLKS